MAKTTVEVQGLKELQDRMSRLSTDIQRNVSRAATAAAANEIKKRAQSAAPVRTGNLQKNIITRRVKPSGTNLTSEHVVTVRSGRVTEKQKKGGLRDAYYWRFVEFGTVKTPAQPFLRPAFDSGKEDAMTAMVERIRKRLEKAGA